MTEPLILTHSDISTFLRCRRTFKWSVVDDWNTPDALTGALALGTRVHQAVEMFHTDGIDPVDAHEMLANDDRAKAAATGNDWVEIDLEKDLEYGTNCVIAYRQWLDDTDPYRNLEVVGVERVVDYPLFDGEVIVQGKIDLLLRDTDSGDYKIEDLKGLALTTPIPTPDGWTTMGALREGDTVFDMDGQPCRVTAKSETKQIGTYIVTFEDGSQIICDPEHYWMVRSGFPYNGRTISDLPLVTRNIEEIRSTMTKNGQKHHRVPVAGALDLPEADLPVDPYLLGCWLGDGSSHSGNITKSDPFFDYLEGLGYTLNMRKPDKRRPHVVTCSPLGLTSDLNRADLLQNKHIPDVYFRASRDQRMALLRGLMDTDGTWNRARHRCVLAGTDKAIMLQARELLLTLGFKPRFTPYTAKGFGKVVEAYQLEFSAVPDNPFSWSEKADRVGVASRRRVNESSRRVIVSVEPGPDVPTACISVDSPSRTYLCGEDMIPTHNTVAPSRISAALNFATRTYQHHVYGTALLDAGFSVRSARYVYLKKVKLLARTADPVQAVDVPVFTRTNHSAQQHLERIVSEIRSAIAEGDSAFYPTPQDACSWCAYNLPCSVADDGRGTEADVLAEKFQHSARLLRYGA